MLYRIHIATLAIIALRVMDGILFAERIQMILTMILIKRIR